MTTTTMAANDVTRLRVAVNVLEDRLVDWWCAGIRIDSDVVCFVLGIKDRT